jgi:PIN domain nuclease of toxin-antitoxin system
MREYRFMLDTNAVLYFIKDSPTLPKRIKEDISCNYGNYFVSVLSIVEIVNKTQSGKLFLTKKATAESLVSELKSLGIDVLPYKPSDLYGLYDLPYFKDHTDPMDRAIFSHAIAQHCVLITSDPKFQKYSKLQQHIFPIR